MVPTSSPESAARPVKTADDSPVVVFDRVSLAFDEKVILDEVSFSLLPGRMKIILGPSGAGKSTILRLILGLLKPDHGAISVNGQRVDEMSEVELMAVRADVGMVFQEGALFDSLTVRENVGYRLFEETRQPIVEVDRRVAEVLGYVGLAEFGERMPSELSGGQRRRVAIARALCAKPRIILYDEPTTGLDPITAISIDEEIVKLRDLDEVTSIVVTHQLRDAFHIALHEATRKGSEIEYVQASEAKLPETEFLMLNNAHVHFEGDAAELRASTDPFIRAFLS